MASVIVPGQLEVDVEDVEHLHPFAQQVRPRALQVEKGAQRLAECQHDHEWCRDRREVVAQPPHAVSPGTRSCVSLRVDAKQDQGWSCAPVHEHENYQEQHDRRGDHRPQTKRAARARLQDSLVSGLLRSSHRDCCGRTSQRWSSR